MFFILIIVILCIVVGKSVNNTDSVETYRKTENEWEDLKDNTRDETELEDKIEEYEDEDILEKEQW